MEEVEEESRGRREGNEKSTMYSQAWVVGCLLQKLVQAMCACLLIVHSVARPLSGSSWLSSATRSCRCALEWRGAAIASAG